MVAYRDRFTKVSVSWPSHDDHSVASLAALKAACRKLKTAMLAVGDVASPSAERDRRLRLVAGMAQRHAGRSSTISRRDCRSSREQGQRLAPLLGLDARECRSADSYAHWVALRPSCQSRRRAQHIPFLPTRRSAAGSARRACAICRRPPRRGASVSSAAIDNGDLRVRHPQTDRRLGRSEPCQHPVPRQPPEEGLCRAEAPSPRGPVPVDPSYDLARAARACRSRGKGPPARTQLWRGSAALWQGLDTPVEQLETLMNWAYEARRICDRVTMSANRIGGAASSG